MTLETVVAVSGENKAIFVFEHAGLIGIERADRLSGKATMVSGRSMDR
jgi:hypothetical protein